MHFRLLALVVGLSRTCMACSALFITLLTPVFTFAQESPSKTTDVDSPVSETEKGDHASISKPGWAMNSLYWLEGQRDYLSAQVTRSATVLDSYLARDAFDSSVVNASYVRINIGQQFSSGFDNDLGASVKLRLDVPNSKQRLRLFFDTDPDDLESINDRRRDNDRSGPDQSDESVVGIELRNKDSRRWKNSARIGARVGSPVSLYARVRTKRFVELSGPWRSRLIQSASYFDADNQGDGKGWLADTQYDIYRPVGDNDILRVSNEAQFTDETARWELFHGYSYYQSLDPIHSLEYSLALTGNNQPNPRVDNYWLRLQWRSRLYKDWLYGKVTPELSFPRSRDFDDTWSLLLELEIFFSDGS